MESFTTLTDLFTGDLVKRASAFAAKAHEGQKRKYTGENYFAHPLTVAGIVAGIGGTKQMVAAALLHDVVEDCGVRVTELSREFGPEVAELVNWLTDVSTPADGNRKARKQIDREHLAKAPAEAQTIKLADLIDNTKSIVAHDPNFAKIYMLEKLLLLAVLTAGDSGLYKYACSLVEDYFNAKH